MTASFPTSAPTTSQLRGDIEDNVATFLSAGINASVTTIPVDDTTGFPSVGLASIKKASGTGLIEVFSYTGKTANSFTGVVRDFNGKGSDSYAENDEVHLYWVADHHNRIVEELIAIATDLFDSIDDDLDDGAIVTAAASSVKVRFDQVVTVLSLILGTDWKSAPSDSIPDLRSDVDQNISDISDNAADIVTLLAKSVKGRNRVVNGAMKFDQRNEGATAYTADNTLDCWRQTYSGEQIVGNIQRATATPPTGFSHYMRATVATAETTVDTSNLWLIDHRIEGNTVKDFSFGLSSAKQVTVSFWVRSSVAGTYCVTLMNSAFDRSYISEFTINVSNTWEKKTITVLGDTSGTWLTDSGIGLRLRFCLSAGPDNQNTPDSWISSSDFSTSNQTQFMETLSATFDLTGVQIEIGPSETEFEHLGEGEELHIIQRYIEKTYDIGTAVGAATAISRYVYSVLGATTAIAQFAIQRWRVKKRAAPTVTGYKTDGTSGQSNVIDGSQAISASGTFNTTVITKDSAEIRITAVTGSPLTADDPYQMFGHWIATSEL